MNPVALQLLLQGGSTAILLVVLYGLFQLAKPFLAGLLAALNANTTALLSVAGKVDAGRQEVTAAKDAVLARITSAEQRVVDAISLSGETHRARLGEVVGSAADRIEEIVRDRASHTAETVVAVVTRERTITGQYAAQVDEQAPHPDRPEIERPARLPPARVEPPRSRMGSTPR